MAALSEGIYLIKSEASGLYAGVQPGGGAKQGAKVVLAELQAEGAERHRQFWHVKPHSAREGAWTLQNVHSTLRMDIMVNRGRAGAAVQQCPPESREDLLLTQLWRPEHVGEDRFVWVNVNSGKHLGVRGERLEANAELEQAEPKEEDDRGTQVWALERVQDRGESKAFDALTARIVSPGALSAPGHVITSALKGILDAGGGVFETMAKTVPDPRAPYLRFDGFRGDEFIRFSPRLGIESGPKKISEQFPQLPTGFSRKEDVLNARKGSSNTHAAVIHDGLVEFSERSASRSSLSLATDEEEFRPIRAATTADTKGEKIALFYDEGAKLLDPRGNLVGEFRLEHAPVDFLTGLDTVTSAPFDDEMHFFLVKGEEFVIVSPGKLIQGATKLTDAYPFLGGVWM
ncbi:RICIN domain-containing protein [Streptomyces silvensis]|uniref:Ricin B lectin domain-containing protein n=1 Tax=Streptomyces silvensis TaxID=1765722 RepID=A0A0W7WY66_9ACTN|nr:RICIN domain-containing protein [Streptomyces silvensis]KUF15505.1 hypothetical protein AT728_25975 [Streptomyces silvensis]